MKKIVLAAVCAFALMAQANPAKAPTPAPAKSPVKLWRLDCGALQDQDRNFYSDTNAFEGSQISLTVSCYLVKHGDDYALFDAGLPLRYLGQAAKPPFGETVRIAIEPQLKQIGVTPAQIKRVMISHYHFDHTGQLAAFPNAILSIGAADWSRIKATEDYPGLERPPFAPWLTGGGKVEPTQGDFDVFGDGSVVMLNLPGHTPGHHGLLVRLAKTGPVLLTGDLSHFAANYASNGVPPVNSDRADTLASLDRFKAMAVNLKAITIIDHEPGDVAKLPAFPKAAE